MMITRCLLLTWSWAAANGRVSGGVYENGLGEHGPKASEVGIVSCISSFEIEGSIIINKLFYVSKLKLTCEPFRNENFSTQDMIRQLLRLPRLRFVNLRLMRTTRSYGNAATLHVLTFNPARVFTSRGRSQ